MRGFFIGINMTAEEQYLAILNDCFENGKDVVNKRTGSKCRTILNQQIVIQPDEFPIITTRKIFYRQAIMEMVCYMRGYSLVKDFINVGVNTWTANAEAIGIAEKGDLSIGLAYGASAEKVGNSFGKLIQDIKKNPTDRGHIWNFWNPEHFYKACLRPCMFNHQFNVIEDTIYLTSTQRSADLPLGTCANMLQAWFLLFVVSKLTGFKMGTVTLNMTNCHIYENQLGGVKEQLRRKPYQSPQFEVRYVKENPYAEVDLTLMLKILNTDNFENYFKVTGYEYHPPIKYPFTV